MIEIHLDLSRQSAPIHLQICEQITSQVEHEILASDDRLPPTRALAHQLNISRGCVVRAYETLVATGICRSVIGRGTFIIGRTQQPAKSVENLLPRMKKEPIDLAAVGGHDLVSLLPSQANIEHLPVSDFRKAFNQTLRYPRRFSEFSEGAGDYRLRALICERLLSARGINASPEHVLIVPGTQYASVLLAMTLSKTHKDLHFGVPGYLDIARNFERFGFALKPHPVDSVGMLLPESALNSDVIYCMPEHHFPQCVALSAERRKSLLDLTEVNDVLVIEDDYDSEFYFNRMPMPALKAQDPNGKVIYLGTFSKTLFNSLRLGYVVANESLINTLASLHWSLSRGTSTLVQRWVGEIIEGGMYERHIRRMRSVYRVKRDAVAELIRRYFPTAQFSVPSGGLQLFIQLSDARSSTAIYSWCKANGVRLADPTAYLMDAGQHADFIVLGFANISLDSFEKMLVKLRLFLTESRLSL